MVHTDELSWSIKSVWTFISEHLVLCLLGVRKDADTLADFFDAELFKGSLLRDDASIYRNVTSAQKCWAHLLRKAIQLGLQDPQNATYRQFADALLALYRKACRIKKDKRYTQATRMFAKSKSWTRNWSTCVGIAGSTKRSRTTIQPWRVRITV